VGRNHSFSEKWETSRDRDKIFKMSLEHLVVPENKEVLKKHNDESISKT